MLPENKNKMEKELKEFFGSNRIREELDNITDFDNYPAIKDFYASLYESSYCWLVKENKADGRVFHYFKNDMSENLSGNYEGFFSEEEIYKIEKVVVNNLKDKEGPLTYSDIKNEIKNEVYEAAYSEKNWLFEEEVNEYAELLNYYNKLGEKGEEDKINNLIKELAEITNTVFDKEEDDFGDLAEKFVSNAKAIEIFNDYSDIVEGVLDATYHSTLVCSNYEEESGDNILLNNYIFGVYQGGEGFLGLLTKEIDDKERAEYVNDLREEEKSAFQEILEEKYGLTLDVLANQKKTNEWKEKNKSFADGLISELENASRYDANTLIFLADMPLGDIIALDIIRDESFSKTKLDLSLIKESKLNIQEASGGFYDYCNGAGSVIDIEFKNIEVPLTLIKPIVQDVMNTGYYEANQCYGFTGTIYEKSKISIIEAKKEELKKENKRKNTI